MGYMGGCYYFLGGVFEFSFFLIYYFFCSLSRRGYAYIHLLTPPPPITIHYHYFFRNLTLLILCFSMVYRLPFDPDSFYIYYLKARCELQFVVSCVLR